MHQAGEESRLKKGTCKNKLSLPLKENDAVVNA
jgi:hypothetical protein